MKISFNMKILFLIIFELVLLFSIQLKIYENLLLCPYIQIF